MSRPIDKSGFVCCVLLIVSRRRRRRRRCLRNKRSSGKVSHVASSSEFRPLLLRPKANRQLSGQPASVLFRCSSELSLVGSCEMLDEYANYRPPPPPPPRDVSVSRVCHLAAPAARISRPTKNRRPSSEATHRFSVSLQFTWVRLATVEDEQTAQLRRAQPYDTHWTLSGWSVVFLATLCFRKSPK